MNTLRVDFLGKNGEVTEALKLIKDIPVAEKKAYGEAVNNLKVTIENKLQSLKEEIQRKALEEKLKNTKKLDLTINIFVSLTSYWI